MDSYLAESFLDAASQVFAFLVNEYSFAQPQVAIDEKINFATVTFMGKNLAIEFILDESESDIDCKIALVVNGVKTSDYAVNDKDVRIREGLGNLLRRRGVRERLFTQVTGLPLAEQIKVTLQDFSQMLSKYGRDVLEDSPTALT